jgi:ribonuclease P protein component
MMFNRQARLRKERDIMRVYQKGRGAVNEWLGIKALSSPVGETRIAVVVSKKVDKRAVVRNKNRRRVAGILQGQVQTYLPSCDIVVTVRQDLSGLSHAELTDLVTGLLKRSQ